MKLVKDLNEYKTLLSEIKKMNKWSFQNNYCYIDVIQKYVSINRLYYVINETGLYFYVDEERYYRLLCYLLPEMPFFVEYADKPIIVRNIFKDKCKDVKMVEAEKKLQAAGFILYNSILQFEVRPFDFSDDIYLLNKEYCKRLEKINFFIGYPTRDKITEIVALREQAKEISLFHLPYRTENELKKIIKNRNYVCIFNSQGKVCAAVERNCENNSMIIEWTAVKPEFQNGKGFGKSLYYYIFEEALEKKIEHIYTWIPIVNEHSLHFHKKNNWVKTGKVTDEWMLF